MQHSIVRKIWIRPIVAIGLCLGLTGAAHAQVFTTLYTFTDSGGNGEHPTSGVVQGTDGNLYGTTYGSTYVYGLNDGTIFRMTPAGVLTTLHAFSGADGSNPNTVLVAASDGSFYGTTFRGGANSMDAVGGEGEVFRITPEGVFTPIYSFTDFDGQNPSGLVMGTDGNLYGTTIVGGESNNGTVFQINPAGVLTTLHSFTGPDGQYPRGLTQGLDGNLYGTTSQGGAFGYGSIFKITREGALTVLHSFDGTGTDGQCPTAGMALATDGNFYGTTSQGGTSTNAGGSSGWGTVFQITPIGVLSTIYSFAESGGEEPLAGLIQGSDGDLYGTTIPAVSAVPGATNESGTANAGTIFQITTSGKLTVMHEFTGPSVGTPAGSLAQGRNGDLYGTAATGGVDNDGSVFALPVISAAQTTPSQSYAHVLWSNASNEVLLTNDNTLTGAVTENTYGPFSGWSAVAVADGPDSLTRVLWINTSGAASIWIVNGATGSFTQRTFGPYAGWTAAAVSVGTDNTTHVLWNNSSGAASVWNYDTQTGDFSQNTFGPYSGWTTKAVAEGADGLTRLLWNNTDGTASVWNVNDSTGAFTQNTFGPYSGWTATAISVNAANTTHVLWTDTTAAISIWNFDSSSGTYTQATYGPFTNWTGISIADAADGNTEVLWDNISGASSLWDLNNTTGSYSQAGLTPSTQFAATAVGAYP